MRTSRSFCHFSVSIFLASSYRRGMAFGSATTRTRTTPGTQVSTGGRATAGSSTSSMQHQQQQGNGIEIPLCTHRQPMLRLECKNGNNR